MTGPKGQDGKDGINGRDGANISMTSAKGEQVLINRDPAHSADTDKAERIVYVPKDASGNPIQDANHKNIVREVATMDDGLKFGGDMGTVNSVKLNKQVDVKGGITDTNKLATGNNIGVTSGIDPTTNNATLNVQLAKDLTGLNSVELGGKTIKTDGDHITITTPSATPGGNATVNKVANLSDEKHIKEGTYAVANDGSVTLNYQDGNKNDLTETAKITGIAKQDLSNITNDGKKEITKLGTIVKAGDNVTVTSTSDGTTGRTTYTVNAVTPAVYTKADGTKVVKRPDGTFTTNLDGATGNDVDKGDVITSFMDGNGNTTGGNMVINNVGSAIDKAGTSTGNTFLTKLDTAATNTPNAAVNVRDLKTTSDALVDKGLKFTGNNTGTENAHKLGSLVKVQGEGVAATDVPTFASAAGNIAVVADGTDTLELKLNKNLKGINSVSNGSSSITLNSNPGGTNNTPAVQITGGNLSMGNGTTNNKIVNVAPGTEDTDAVNYSQIKGLRTEVKQGANVTVNKTQGTDGHDIYTISATATGGTASSWNIKSSADTANGGATATGHDANAVNISDQKTVEMVAGKNLTVKQGTTTDGAKVEFALSDNIVAGKDGANGKDGSVGATGKDGSSVVINGADGSIGMTGPKGQDGKDGINGRDGANISMTSAKGEQVLVNRDPAHSADNDKAERIVYVPKDANGDPVKGADGKNIVREVATMDDGLKFTGNNESTVNNNKLNTLVKVQGEGTKEGTNAAGAKEIQTSDGTKFESAKDNIAVVADGTNTLTVKLNKNLKGLDSVQTKTVELGDHTTPGGTTNITYNSGDKRIEYTTPGAAGGTETKKVATTDDLWTIQGNGTDVAPVNGKVNVKAGENILITTPTTADGSMTINAVTPAVYTDKDGNKLTKDKDGKFHKDDGTEVAAADVITSIQDAAGNVTGGNSIVNNVGSAIQTQTGGNFLEKLDKATDTTNPDARPNAVVNVSDLKSTADALRAKELHIAPTSGGTDTDKGGVVKTAGSTDMVYKYDAASKTVTLTYNDGNGKAVTGPKAVLDFTDLNIPAGGNNYGFKANATANGGTVANNTTTPAAATAVENGGTVNFAAGKNLTVKQDIDTTNKTQTYTFSLDKELTNLDKVVVNGKAGQPGKDGVTIVGPQGATGTPGTNGIDGKVGISGKDGKDAVSISGKDGVGHIGLTGPQGPQGPGGTPGTPGANIDISTDHGTQTLVKPEVNNNDKSERIVYVPKDSQGNPLKDTDGNVIKREVATMDDGLKFAGDDGTVIKKALGTQLDIVGGATGALSDNNIGVNNDNGKLKVQLAKNIDLTKDGSVTMGDTVVNNGGITIKAPTTPGTTTTDVKLTNQGLDNGGNKITNVKAGTDGTDAVNVQQLKDNVTTVTSDGSITVTDTNTDPTKGHAYNIKVNSQGVVNNAQLPVVYTKEDGTKVYLVNNKFYDNPEGNGAEVPKAQVIASMNNADNSSTTPMKLNNVGSSIAGETGATFLDKLDTANTNTPNGAVNVSDLKNTADAIGEKGLNFGTQSTGANSEIHKNLGEKLEIVGGGTKADDEYDASNIKTMTKDGKVVIALDKNIKADSVTVGEKGQPGVPGKDGVDGKIGVNGKDGSAVVINGKDGSIGLNGKDGANGITIKGDKGVDGVDGLNGTNGITRIVYQDKDGNKHEVATHDDGLKFTGNNTSVENKHKLNTLVKVQGEGVTEDTTSHTLKANNKDFASAAGNIAVVADNHDTLTVKMNKDLANINSIRNNPTSGPVMNFNAGDIAISGGNLSMGGNKITNVKAGTDGTDAVNLDQLKAARTKVTSDDRSVRIHKNENNTTGEITYDLSVDPNATPDLDRVNNRIDQLGEEIGRVGAQGAALSALKPIQYDPLEPTQIMAGYGNYRGNSAVALGVAHYKNESTLIHGGVSWAGGSSHMMANAGVTWKVGNRDSEAAVADRYRKGPISSAYAMQQEMAAMKAQNAGLKGEVSDLKAENEQMKAQIAAMMAKLGL